jgi:hypothetical protein
VEGAEQAWYPCTKPKIWARVCKLEIGGLERVTRIAGSIHMAADRIATRFLIIAGHLQMERSEPREDLIQACTCTQRRMEENKTTQVVTFV